jgi:hypothetical protein
MGYIVAEQAMQRQVADFECHFGTREGQCLTCYVGS